MNAGPRLRKRVIEMGAASIRNYAELARRWFAHDLTRYELYLMPVGFIDAPGNVTGIVVGAGEGRLLEYLDQLAEDHAENTEGFHAALEVHISLKRSTSTELARVQITRDPTAPKVQVSEEEILKQFPWDYKNLTKRLYDRYTDFVQNQKYHDIRKRLRDRPEYVLSRYLEPGNPRSARKDYYNPNILQEFDKHYTRK